MTAERQDLQWFPRLVVLAAGIALGFFAWRTYVVPVSPLYPLAFNHGQWLMAVDESPQSYFRKELHIPTAVQQAWVAVAGTDSFVLYVNGKAVDANAYVSLNVSGIYDIGPYLQPGKNVIGVLVRRKSYPGAAMAVAEGVYVDESSQEHSFATDGTWKFSVVEQRQGDGDIPWHSPWFDDHSWSPSRTAGQPTLSEIYPLDIHPLALTMTPQGKWIGPLSPQPSRATFAQTFTLPSRPEEAWLRIAAKGSYAVTINGVTITGEKTSRDALGMRLVRLQADQIWQSPVGSSTDLYRIAPLLHSGSNHLIVTTEPPFAAFPGLFIDGFLSSHGTTLTFGSDASWLDLVASQMSNGEHPVPPGATQLVNRDPVGTPLPLKKPLKVVLPTTYVVRQGGELVLIVFITIVLTFAVWGGVSRLLYQLSEGDVRACGRAAALTFLPTLVFLGGLLLLSFDVRIDPTLPYRGWVSCVAVVTLPLLSGVMMLAAWRGKPERIPVSSNQSMTSSLLSQSFGVVVLLGLILVGAFMRLQGLDTQSLYHDEIHMVSFVKGLLHKGYPYIMLGPFEIPLSTYELVPYPIALSTLLFGFNDFALRLPAAMLGIMTIPLIYVVGSQVFGKRVGLLAATMYTFCPQALLWAKYLWHPQQVQFFALLTSYLFYRAVQAEQVSAGYLYLAAIAFILTYLSWEGAGFLLPALAIGLLVVRGKDTTWLHAKHLWVSAGIVVVAVTLQLGRRILLQIPYLVVGTGLSDVSLPTLFFLDPMYDPTFYIKNFLWLENNVVLTFVLIAGLPLLGKQPGASYYVTLLLAILLMMTNLLPRATIRYLYYTQPFLVLSASALTWCLYDRVMNMAQSSRLKIACMLCKAIAVPSFALLILGSSFYMKFYRFNNFSDPTGSYTRENTYYIDYRSSSSYVKSHYKPGDLLIVTMPEPFSYYSGKEADYFIENYVKRQVFYDPVHELPRYLEKTIGVASIKDIADISSIFSNYRRVWVVATPHSIFTSVSGSDIIKYVSKHATVVYESYDARIYLLSQ